MGNGSLCLFTGAGVNKEINPIKRLAIFDLLRTRNTNLLALYGGSEII